jgi:hypothetical protein
MICGHAIRIFSYDSVISERSVAKAFWLGPCRAVLFVVKNGSVWPSTLPICNFLVISPLRAVFILRTDEEAEMADN